MSKNTVKNKIFNILNTTMLGTIAIASPQNLTSALVIFGNDNRGTIYICTGKNSKLVLAAEQAKRTSFTVYREEEDLQNIAALNIYGTIQLLHDPHSRESLTAYHYLDKKSPLLGNIPAEQRVDDYRVLVLKPDSFHYQSYAAYQAGEAPVILRRRNA